MLKGKVHKYGADVNTDVIIPARYLDVYDPAELARHCMEDIDTEFVKRVEPYDRQAKGFRQIGGDIPCVCPTTA